MLAAVHETFTPLLEPYFEKAGLLALKHHWHLLLASFAFWHVVMFASSKLSPLVAPRTYPQLAKIRKINWDIHVASMVHCLTVLYLAWQVLGLPVLKADKVFGYDPYAGNVYAFTCGYFLWDGLTSLRYVRHFGVSFLIHGVVCFSVFIFCFRPFVMYFGAVYLMFELSTPFLNVHWFMDKVGMTGSIWQAINGAFLIGAFFLARIAFGVWTSFEFMSELYRASDRVPAIVIAVYAVCNVAMNLLNMYWFRAMVSTVLRRFQKPEVDTSKDTDMAARKEQLAKQSIKNAALGKNAAGLRKVNAGRP
ncbi:TLC domain-containing protein [Thamnocephalis sphaerospora]|uniref:TLC domain-containing protein n=1 Tax=Thamnocephalis sphaerospora TaxID=78915 RepID=A0A4P9XVL7_9FUNG|nr:TLC domain-containing protein [Thamnocephalis sphaerospora]|eukprot:RKP10316.1 TLC domain-containing protein [Thamnocephalis sphaerospora]